MNALIQRFRQLSRARKLLILGLISGLVIVGIAAAQQGEEADTSITVTRGTVTQMVSVTGRMKPVESVDLSFQGSGRVVSVPVAVGDLVIAGQVLASLDNGELYAQLRDAQASVLTQQARLENIQGGGRAEEIAIAETELRSAQQTLENTYDDVQEVLADAYAKADSALHIQLYPLFEDTGTDTSPNYQLSFDCSCYNLVATALNARVEAEVNMIRWRSELTDLSLGATPAIYNAAVENALRYLQTAVRAVNAVGVILEDSSPSGLSEADLTDYRTRVNTARVSLSAGVSAVQAQHQIISTNTIAVQRAQDQLALTVAGATPQEINAQKAQVLSAQAQVERIQSLIGKNVIRSPIKGIVTLQEAKLGQTAAAGQTMVSVISDQQLEIEVNVPEVDIGKISLGDRVRFSVDALPEETFTAVVSFIDPAETLVDGVVNFKVKIVVDTPDSRLKSGLTVNVDIESESRENVLLLPQFAIIENDEGSFVRKITAQGSEEVAVTLGIRGHDGTVELLSGVEEGERVENIGIKKNGN
jgi:HlyD family secretion protein